MSLYRPESGESVISAVSINDQFAFWQKELLKSSPGAHAIIHDKVVVVDPFSSNCVVITVTIILDIEHHIIMMRI